MDMPHGAAMSRMEVLAKPFWNRTLLAPVDDEALLHLGQLSIGRARPMSSCLSEPLLHLLQIDVPCCPQRTLCLSAVSLRCHCGILSVFACIPSQIGALR